METFLILMQFRGFPVSLVTSFARVSGGGGAKEASCRRYGMEAGITASPEWAVIPVAACCAAQTPSEQTRLQ